MAYRIASKDQLFEYCKRRLGDPVVQINVTDEQIEDCYDETLTFWQIYDTNGTEKVYIKHQITGTVLTLVDGSSFQVNDTIVGLDSLGAEVDVTAVVHAVTGNLVTIKIQTATKGQTRFTLNQSVKNKRTSAVTTISAIALGDTDNRSVPLDSSIYGVQRLFPFSLGQGQSGSASLFNLQYQLRLHELGNLSNVSLQYYVQTMTNIRMLDSILNGAPLFRFNRFHDKLEIDAYWGSTLNVGDWILIEAYKSTDPAAALRAFGDPWLVKHMTANIKRQWGVNIKKFGGMQLPGGVTIDGQGMYDEAMGELKELEDDLIANGQPLEFFCA